MVRNLAKMKCKDHRNCSSNIFGYDRQAFSALADKGAENPIFDYLKQKPRSLIVADLDCGAGRLLPFLSQQFQKVVAVDYFQSSFRKAEKYALPNVEYRKMDMRNLGSLYNKLDIATSVSARLPKTIKK